MTLLESVQTQSARLTQAGVSFGHGTNNAFDEAAWLVLWALGLPLDALDENAAHVLTEDELARIDALVARRIGRRQPAAYLTREAWLQGVPFYVDERAIVPRSFIAEVIPDGTIHAWAPPDTRRVLDLCTGNGSLAVLAAMAWPDASVDASDISPGALAVARINIDQHGLGDRVTVFEGDGLAAVGGPYDLILCNPPYVNAKSMAQLPAEYRAEPALALDGGQDGMDFIRRLLHEAPEKLSEDGLLVLEVGNEREHFEQAFPSLEATWLETSAGSDQVLLIERTRLRA